MGRVLGERLGRPDCKKGFILDGYPRTLPQADELERLLETRGTGVTVAIVIEASTDLLLRRLGGRRSCAKCGAIYNIYTLKPAREGVCDKCGGALVIRPDDQIETIRKRLQIFGEQSAPLIERYRAKGVAASFSSDAPIDDVVNRMVEHVGRVRSS
jgi:adenylate kinase